MRSRVSPREPGERGERAERAERRVRARSSLNARGAGLSTNVTLRRPDDLDAGGIEGDAVVLFSPAASVVRDDE